MGRKELAKIPHAQDAVSCDSEHQIMTQTQELRYNIEMRWWVLSGSPVRASEGKHFVA
ncbi:MAG: hypothetical protein VXZ49_07190 [Planctomycetota bacterium]|nr:hypothetical protein [Planctomycetota bacterium]